MDADNVKARNERYWAASGLVYVVCIFVGNSMTNAGQQGGDFPTGAQVIANLNNASAVNHAGFVLEVCGFVSFMVFLGYLAVRLRGTGTAGATALVAGLITLAVKLASASPIAALVLERKTIGPGNALLLSDVNSGAFVLSWLPYAVFVGLAAVALREIAAIGKVALAFGLVAGATGVVAAIAGMSDPRNAFPIPFLVGVCWVGAVSIRELWRPNTQPTAAHLVPTPA